MKSESRPILNKIQKQYEGVNEECHKIDKRVIKLEESIDFIKDDLTLIKSNCSDLKKSLTEIREEFKFHEGASETKKTGWKVIGYIVTVLATLGVHHIFLRWFDIHL